MNKFNEFDLIKTPRNWIDEVTATNFEPTKRACCHEQAPLRTF